ncbi:hypothetical protein AB4120_12345 [Cupriavidus sp. 2KB_3]|uniref:hypothetical protein n=1 Tax=Cupriavidus TaxID=106589 RepID=UPI0011EBC0D9|nr:hypothetical protein [Cupriavidus campinensis]
MRASIGLAGAIIAASAAQAQPALPPQDLPPPASAEWALSAFGYWNVPRGGDNYASGIFTADRSQLHLEARTGYEARHAHSAFVGWTFSVGEAIKLDATPIIGVVVGDVSGGIAGLEARVTAGRFDGYVEFEYVNDWRGRESSYAYAWSELAYRPFEWLRLGLVAQRTRAYGGDRDLQRGGFFQLSFGKLTAGAYLFNPGSRDQVAIMSVGIGF